MIHQKELQITFAYSLALCNFTNLLAIVFAAHAKVMLLFLATSWFIVFAKNIKYGIHLFYEVCLFFVNIAPRLALGYLFKSRVLNLCSLIYLLANFIGRIYPEMFLYVFTFTNAYCIGS